MNTKITLAIVVAVMAGAIPSMSQTAVAPQQPAATTPAPQPARANRPPPPTRDPNTPGYVKARHLPDGAVPAADAYGNFVIGPTYTPAPEMTVQPGVPQGTIHNFEMSSADSKIIRASARARYIRQPDSKQSGKLDVTPCAAPYAPWLPCTSHSTARTVVRSLGPTPRSVVVHRAR